MDIPSHIFKSYDIRGIYPSEINEDNIDQIITAIYAFFKQKIQKDKFTVVLARDMRISSPKLFDIAKEKLIEMGASVIDAGLISTPTFYFAVWHYGYDAGIQITASHNPKDYNGVKIVMKGDKGLIKIGKPTGMEDIKRMALEGVEVRSESKGTVEVKSGILEDEIQNAISLFNKPQLEKFKIVADPANAMGATYIEELFNHVPADLIKMNFELDGTFPAHQPDPLQFDTLKDLQKKVVDEGADLGLAPDGDGDRLFFIDERGEIVPATIITAIVAKELLAQYPGETILFDIRYIMTPQKIVEEFGGKSQITKVGHAFITEQLNSTGGVFAGESSAHFYYRSTGNAESQVITILAVLKALTEENKTMSQLVDEYKKSHESGEINFEVSNASEIIDVLKEKYQDGELSTLDGIAISYPEWRFSVRTSNTEPLLRLNVEGYNKSVVEPNTRELIEIIKSNAQH